MSKLCQHYRIQYWHHSVYTTLLIRFKIVNF
jgi:hypothetical protein